MTPEATAAAKVRAPAVEEARMRRRPPAIRYVRNTSIALKNWSRSEQRLADRRLYGDAKLGACAHVAKIGAG
jgi:hypothetical protein